MASNPFDYQRPLRGELIDRASELDALQRAAADRVAVNLVSPRRFGKTSLLRAHLAAMRAAGHRACYVDFDRVATVPDVAERLAEGFRELPSDPERRIDRRLARIGITAGTAGLTVGVAPRARTRSLTADEARAAIRDMLALPAELSERGDLTVVAMDEFQDLLTADDRLDGVFRSVIQHQRDVAYVFAGSSPSLMRELFGDRERPFYGQARPLQLPPLPEDETVRHVLERLPDRPAAADAGVAVVRLAAGHPQRTMLLAHHLFNVLDESVEHDEDAVGRALARALTELDDGFRTTWGQLARAERLVVTALADGAAPTSRRVAAEHGIARSTLQRALERVERDDQLVTSSPPRLLDPLFAEWLRRR